MGRGAKGKRTGSPQMRTGHTLRRHTTRVAIPSTTPTGFYSRSSATGAGASSRQRSRVACRPGEIASAARTCVQYSSISTRCGGRRSDGSRLKRAVAIRCSKVPGDRRRRIVPSQAMLMRAAGSAALTGAPEARLGSLPDVHPLVSEPRRRGCRLGVRWRHHRLHDSGPIQTCDRVQSMMTTEVTRKRT